MTLELILMIGIAGSGKTTLSKMLFSKHKRVSLDDISDSNREIESDMVHQHLKNGHNVVIDDTNLTMNIRARHISIAMSYNAKINAIFIDLPMWKIREQNKSREKSLPDIALFKMKTQLERPSETEGFDFIQVCKTVNNLALW